MEELFEAVRCGKLDEIKDIVKIKGVAPAVVNEVYWGIMISASS